MGIYCNVCGRSYPMDDLEENFRGMYECPECGTELAKNKSHGGQVKRDQHSHK